MFASKRDRLASLVKRLEGTEVKSIKVEAKMEDDSEALFMPVLEALEALQSALSDKGAAESAAAVAEVAGELNEVRVDYQDEIVRLEENE